MNEGRSFHPKLGPKLTVFPGAVFLVVVVIAVLSYHFFASAGGDAAPGAGARAESRQSSRRQVTPAMVEV
jgi:hypothetical protein